MAFYDPLLRARGRIGELTYLQGVSTLVVAYLLARGAGTLLGVELGGLAVALPASTRRALGLSLFPQAGVALGMALLAAQRLPEHGQLILSVVLASTLILELGSPVITRWALLRHARLAGPQEEGPGV